MSKRALTPCRIVDARCVCFANGVKHCPFCGRFAGKMVFKRFGVCRRCREKEYDAKSNH